MLTDAAEKRGMPYSVYDGSAKARGEIVRKYAERLRQSPADWMTDEPAKFGVRQDSKGGDARAASKGSEKPRESTAPTDDQIREALEFLRMFRENEKPSNEFEATALDRIEQLVARTLEKGRKTTATERPQPMDTESPEAAMADEGGGTTDRQETDTSGAVYNFMTDQNENVSFYTNYGDFTKAMDSWNENGRVGEAPRMWDKNYGEMNLDEFNKRFGTKTTRSQWDKQMSSNVTAVEQAARNETKRSQLQKLEQIKNTGPDMALMDSNLELEDYKDMGRSVVNSVVNAPLYVGEGIMQAGAFVGGAAAGAVKGGLDGSGVLKGAWTGAGAATSAVHEAGNTVRNAVNLQYHGARGTMGETNISFNPSAIANGTTSAAPTLDGLESTVLSTVGGLAVPGKLFGGAKTASTATRAAETASTATKVPKPAAARMMKIEPVMEPTAPKPVAPKPVAPKPITAAPEPTNLIPKVTLGKGLSGEAAFGAEPWGHIQKIAAKRGIKLPAEFRPATGPGDLRDKIAGLWASKERFIPDVKNSAYVRSFGYVMNPKTKFMGKSPDFLGFRGTGSNNQPGNFLTYRTERGVGVHMSPDEVGGRGEALVENADHFGMFGKNGEFFSVW